MQFERHICRFQNSRGWCCAAYNEVAIDYNAAFTGAIARLVDFYDGMKPFSDCTLELGWSHPNASLVRLHPRCCHHPLAESCMLSATEAKKISWYHAAWMLSGNAQLLVAYPRPHVFCLQGAKWRWGSLSMAVKLKWCAAGFEAAVAGGRLLPQLLQW